MADFRLFDPTSDSGFFTGGAGTDAAVGQGATTPVAAGDNSLAQGDSTSAAGDNSLAIGASNTASAASTFAMGSSNNITTAGRDSLLAGTNNYNNVPNSLIIGRDNISNYSGTPDPAYHSNTIIGYDNHMYGGYVNFACGYDNIINSSASISCTMGASNTVNGSSAFTLGFNNNNTGSSSTAIGQGITLSGAFNFLHGRNLSTNNQSCLLLGDTNRVSLGSSQFAVGTANYGYAGNTLLQGSRNRSCDSSAFAQGFRNDGGNNSFAQGTDCSTGVTAFMTHGAVTGTFIATQNVVGGTSGAAGRMAVIGAGNLTLTGVSGTFVNGEVITAANNASATTTVVTMGGVAINNFAQGDSCIIDGSNNFAQGYSNSITADRGFAQGVYSSISRDDQKTWGSNRTGTSGAAQSSHIVKYLSTPSNTITTIITLDLEQDKAYSLRCNLIGRDTTSNGNNVSYVLAQAMVYRDSGGVATLSGSPVFTQDATGAGTTTAAIISVSGNNALIRVTGNSGQVYQWCCDLEFVEVLG